ncbi:hypothetical protein BZA05DRAFT_111491 [Tricharina praecox]|uniref:uncharacterized protein n=1 Tax=Tricharina praecox TaxID=43433 RepID=UPI0022206D7D|nr:uncharacterized protein BZA05DRAFT_111491 [Tricharina praecox]KAI5857977.1 hypothetical protein BZA05DRAFT_111491 [Tricharina praecox]
MAGHTNADDYPRSAGAVLNPHSFAARAAVVGSHPTFSRSNTDPSESLSPRDRYRDGGMTIRAVTPEPEAEFEPDLDDPTALAAHTTTPPRTPSRSTIRSSSRWDLLGRSSPEPTAAPAPASPEKSRSIMNRASMTAAAQLADLNISRAKSRSPTERMWYSRAGASSPEDTRFDVGSPSYVARHRYGPSQGVLETGTLPTSVGYPSTQAVQLQNSTTTRPSTGKSGRHRLLRPSASITTLQQQNAYRGSVFGDQPLPTSPVNADFDTLVKLMKRVRGRMDGYVEFRLGEHRVWTKGYCQIDIDTGALLYQQDENNTTSPPHVIVPDLRSCHVKSSAEDEGMIDLSTHSLKIEMKLRPLSVQQYDQWLAALLCWSPIRPAGAQNKRVKSQMPVLTKEKRRRNSDATVQNRGDATIIKVGKMLLWRPVVGPTAPPTGSHKSSSKIKPPHGVAWQSISCTLQENGEFRLHRDLDSQILAVVQLSQLSRCAVQQLDPSILDQDFCIAIYPQYTPNASNPTQLRPVYLGIDTRILFEVWFVLLRAFTMPELYGPPAPSAGLGTITAGAASESRSAGALADSYRIQRGLYLRIVEAKINMNPHNERESGVDCYAEVVLDGEARAKTMVRTKTHNPFWREDYEFPDLPTVLTDVAVVLKQRDPRWRTKANGSTVAGSGGFGGGLGGVSLPGSNDTIIGRVDVRLDRLTKNEFERWLPLVNARRDGTDEHIGEMYLRAETEELIVLMGSEYKVLSDLLHQFSSGITLHIARVITDLRRLADTLLQIFQVSSKASEWLMALAEGEIDGLHKETPIIEDKPTSQHESEPLARHKSGLVDANILFRGNSLLTRALDTHMKRLGREYLEETLGDHLQKIAAEDTYCEVDPMRIDSPEHIQRNWKQLLSITRTIWQAIFTSASRCPLELRKILRHIRLCVEDRYGDLLRTVSYSSVCGFLFLRFFVPAILNPKLFGLLKDHPGVRAQRTLTLIAKALQGLANMTTFGIKEPWMSPMNEFLAEHKDELKDFVDSVTTISPALDRAVKTVPPSYVTPITILNRLSGASKEGFPSLPYLIDQPRAFAALVAMWLKHCTPSSALDKNTREFDSVCRSIQHRIHECIAGAEDAERPGSSASAEAHWEEVAEKATGVPARDGVYTRGGRGGGLQRVAPCTVDDAVVGSLGYSVNVSAGSPAASASSGSVGRSSRSLGGILGFGGSRRKERGKVEVGEG